jgi:hypothetical protein
MDNFRNIHPSFRTIFQLSPQDFFVPLRHDLLGHPTRSERVVYRRRVAPRVGVIEWTNLAGIIEGSFLVSFSLLFPQE